MRERPVREGEVLSVDVAALADGPDALAKVGDYVLFVAGALPGERVRVKVTEAGRKYGRATLLQIERPAKERVPPKCPHFGVCGGCHFQHFHYPAQLAHKTARLKKELAHALKRSDLPIEEMVGPEDPWGQRNKIALHVEGRAGAPIAGLYKMRSREVIPLRECPVSDPKGMELAFKTRELVKQEALEPWHERSDRGSLRAIVVRSSGAQERSVTLVSRRPHFPNLPRISKSLLAAGATSVALNVNERPGPSLLGWETEVVGGRPRIRERVAGIDYLSSPGAFFQTSRWGAEKLVEIVTRLAAPARGARILDLYSGGGLLSLPLAKRGARVTGIEENPHAVEDAVASAKANRLPVRFLRGKVEWKLGQAARGEGRLDAVILDPPREGAAPAVLDAIVRAAPDRIVYVSCDPAALGRDLAHLEAKGCYLQVVEPLDMFPHAFHIEAVALLTGPARK